MSVVHDRADHGSPGTPRRRGWAPTSTWADNAHFEGWYPVACSSELTTGEIVGRDFLGTRVVMFRTADGQPVVLHGHCAHMGADLSCGALVDDEVQCGFHHFRYGSDGSCRYAPGGRIPAGASVFSFDVREQWGAIWAFNGTTATYEVPEWPGQAGRPMRTRVRRIEVPCEPWVLVANAYDIVHLSELHGLHIPLAPTDLVVTNPYVMEYDITWTADGLGEVGNRGRSYGTNAFFSRNSIVGGFEMFSGQASTPTTDGRVDCYMFVAAPDDSDGDAARLAEIDEQLTANEAFVDRLIADDLPILAGLRLRIGATVQGDRMLNHFLGFVRDFPRCAPDALGPARGATAFEDEGSGRDA